MPWMNIDCVIHCFIEGGQSDDFHLRFWAKLQWVGYSILFIYLLVGL